MATLGRRVGLVLFTLMLLFVARAARADGGSSDEKCTGPEACCPDKVDERIDHVVTVKPGVVLLGVANVNERSGTWDADYYLYEEWPPTPAFTPRTEVVNEVERKSVAFDDTELRDGTCVRSRRIHSTLRSEFNLHVFPFDEQTLTLQLSDDQYESTEVRYGDKPHVAGLDDAVRTMVSGWQVSGEPTYVRTTQAFKWEPGAPHYDYGTFGVTVRRHVTFHLTRYFLPLFIILIVALSAFWIDPEDLNSQMAIGVTCLLAAIALQFAEGGTLPEVSYLTLADRVYAVCYVGIAGAVVESVVVNAMVRKGHKERAMRIDRLCRYAFPVAILLALALSTQRSFAIH
jgi:hypothetical protein